MLNQPPQCSKGTARSKLSSHTKTGMATIQNSYQLTSRSQRGRGLPCQGQPVPQCLAFCDHYCTFLPTPAVEQAGPRNRPQLVQSSWPHLSWSQLYNPFLFQKMGCGKCEFFSSEKLIQLSHCTRSHSGSCTEPPNKLPRHPVGQWQTRGRCIRKFCTPGRKRSSTLSCQLSSMPTVQAGPTHFTPKPTAP